MGSQDQTYSDEAYDIFPRYTVLDAILVNVETLDPDKLPDLRELIKLLTKFGQGANSDLTGHHDNSIAVASEQNERDRFAEVIRKAAAEDFPIQEPLFYRRVLSAIEVAELWKKISEKWGAAGDYWYPLGDRTHPSLLALELDLIDEAKLQSSLRKFMVDFGETRIFELREHGPENYLLDAGVDDFFCSDAEGYWIPQSNEWIIYCSHEGTITLGGSIADVGRKGLLNMTA